MSDHESLAEYLKVAQPRLVVRVVRDTGLRFKITPYIKEVEHGCEASKRVLTQITIRWARSIGASSNAATGGFTAAPIW